ncbi:NAD(P)/FAD-dependent oxidoreductase [Maribacter sp. MJ134]|uniref:NAD(P)/FAD-dependent oxidoreductase n=1 Tax=Maribacter sp. MJ134 TaxID=2496865 RepID=UPI000F81E257|nr:FAD/NAD(P)-binding oxidoreductase [Maribacter sp. MJ134]AZQ57837.1 NAD(P)/FAD-dependent oxidoreductase [Maribacter sp. MJ134]
MEGTKSKIAVIIGASHAGVQCAFALRKEGWKGKIILFDVDTALPYHRPPLSKSYLTSENPDELQALKPTENYVKEDITLKLGCRVTKINKETKNVEYDGHAIQTYDSLVLATGAKPFKPPIFGLEKAKHLYSLRNLSHVRAIKKAILKNTNQNIVVIGGGYIGLETAASLKNLGANVTVLEREERVLARVTSPEISSFFTDLHTSNGVQIHTNKSVVAVTTEKGINTINCADTSNYKATIIILGCGIVVNTDLAKDAELQIENGIRVDKYCRTDDPHIYAIGDCTYHYNLHYERFVRLESVQNAVDQAKVAAAAICDKKLVYDSIPWFWSDQYDVKLQMVGLSEGYDQVLVRKEKDRANVFSVWYFKGDTLLAVDAVNNARAYVIATKTLKDNIRLDKEKLIDSAVELKPVNLIVA